MPVERPRGLVLSWVEAFQIVPDLAQLEVEKIVAELEEAKAKLHDLEMERRGDCLRQFRRSLQLEAILREAVRYGGFDARRAMDECRRALGAVKAW